MDGRSKCNSKNNEVLRRTHRCIGLAVTLDEAHFPKAQVQKKKNFCVSKGHHQISEKTSHRMVESTAKHI